MNERLNEFMSLCRQAKNQARLLADETAPDEPTAAQRLVDKRSHYEAIADACADAMTEIDVVLDRVDEVVEAYEDWRAMAVKEDAALIAQAQATRKRRETVDLGKIRARADG